MTPKLEAAQYVQGHTIHVLVVDGTEANIDLSGEIWGEVFAPLEDPAAFRCFELEEVLNTITWASGADFASEFFYEKAAQ